MYRCPACGGYLFYVSLGDYYTCEDCSCSYKEVELSWLDPLDEEDLEREEL